MAPKDAACSSVHENYQIPFEALKGILKLLSEGGIALPSHAAGLTYWILRTIAEQEGSQEVNKKMVSLGSVAEMAKRFGAATDAEAEALDQSTGIVRHPGIPISQLLSSDFKMTTHVTTKPAKVSVTAPSASLFRRVEATEDWENHELCQKYGLCPEEVRLAAQSVIDMGLRAYRGTFEGKTDIDKMQDRAIMNVFEKGDSSTGKQLALLAERFLEIEEAGMKTMTLQRLGDKLRNFEYRKEPGKILISEHQEFDLWLSQNWVQKELLCRLSNKKIEEKWTLHKGVKWHTYSARLIESRINRFLKLRRPKLKKSQPQ